MIALAAGAWRAVLRPETGGAMAALDLAGVPVLRTMADTASGPLESACFPMVPYCNRIAGGRFQWGGRTVTLAPNAAGQRHPLHGLGWLAPWRVVRADTSSALLEHRYEGAPADSGEWPWAYVAHQHIALDESGCTVRLMVQNLSADTAPMGLGLHPYFRRADDSTVTFAAKAMLGIDGDFLVDGSAHPADSLARWSEGSPLPGVLVDHPFTRWAGEARVADSHGGILLRGFGAPHCHVFAPPDGKELCFEPVSHPPDALNRTPEAMPAVQPGCAAGIAMRIEASLA